MKTAISVDDDLIREADRTAHEMGVSRSRLFSLALQRFLRDRRNAALLDELNQVYAGESAPEERTAMKIKSKFRATIKDRW
jgi:metal-responsive CopG/Arc/MetJ family transcriptional regulator